MAVTVESKVLVALRTAIAAIVSPTLTVVEGARPGTDLPHNTVQLTPLAIEHLEAPGAQRRWQFRVLVLLRSTLGSPTATASANEDCLTALRAVLTAIKGATALYGGGGAGVEDTRREQIVLWAKLGAKPGDPIGASLIVESSWCA